MGKRFSLGCGVRSACRVAALGCDLVQSPRLLPSRDPGESQEPHPRYEWGHRSCDTKPPPTLPPWRAPGPRQPLPPPTAPPETILVTTTRGKAYHRRGCIHVRGHETRMFRPCLVCQPHVTLQEEDARARLQAHNHDDAQRDTNHAIAHFSWWLVVLLVGGTSLSLLTCSCWLSPWRAPRPANLETNERVGSLARRVRFRLSTDSDSEAEGGSPATFTRVDTNASLTTRHHRKRGRHPLVASQGSSPQAARRAHSANGPQAGVLPAHAWAKESLRLVRDHLAPTTQRLYDSHWRWWELFTRRRGVSALRTVGRFDPGEERALPRLLGVLVCGSRPRGCDSPSKVGSYS